MVVLGGDGSEVSGDGVAEVSRVTFKPRKCRACRRVFTPDRFGKVCCQPACAIVYMRMGGANGLQKATKKVQAAEKREIRAKLTSLSKLKNLAQREVNHYIRLRDHDLGCISCNAGPEYRGQWTAGHYRSRGAADHLRFNEDNLAKQCGQCNYHKSGNQVAFRAGLLARIGAARVELLEDDNRTIRWERDELNEIRKRYLGKWKALEAERGAK